MEDEDSQADGSVARRMGLANEDSQGLEPVENCIVGSCNKYYHISCLEQNQNVDFYRNSKNQMRFRCSLHYCSGCSISGNSVQILQCVRCPTSYHLKCFRADKNAVKLTKKMILCGLHLQTTASGRYVSDRSRSFLAGTS